MTSSGSQSSGLLWTTYTNDYWLAENPDEVTVKITYYEGIGNAEKYPLAWKREWDSERSKEREYSQFRHVPKPLVSSHTGSRTGATRFIKILRYAQG